MLDRKGGVRGARMSSWGLSLKNSVATLTRSLSYILTSKYYLRNAFEICNPRPIVPCDSLINVKQYRLNGAAPSLPERPEGAHDTPQEAFALSRC